jgi:hypothetical protein
LKLISHGAIYKEYITIDDKRRHERALIILYRQGNRKYDIGVGSKLNV